MKIFILFSLFYWKKLTVSFHWAQTICVSQLVWDWKFKEYYTFILIVCRNHSISLWKLNRNILRWHVIWPYCKILCLFYLVLYKCQLNVSVKFCINSGEVLRKRKVCCVYVFNFYFSFKKEMKCLDSILYKIFSLIPFFKSFYYDH